MNLIRKIPLILGLGLFLVTTTVTANAQSPLASSPHPRSMSSGSASAKPNPFELDPFETPVPPSSSLPLDPEQMELIQMELRDLREENSFLKGKLEGNTVFSLWPDSFNGLVASTFPWIAWVLVTLFKGLTGAFSKSDKKKQKKLDAQPQ